MVILINQLASVDQAFQDLKGVTLNFLLSEKFLLYFPIHFFSIRHYCYRNKVYSPVSVTLVLKYGPLLLNMRCSHPALVRDVLNGLQLLSPLIKFKEEQKGLCS